MSNILLLDLGNSRLKWAVYPNTHIDQPALTNGAIAVEKLNKATLNQAWRKLPAVEQAYICAVGQQAVQFLCQEVVKQKCKVKLQSIRVSAQKAGVINSYALTQNLGVDRWMGLLAAHALNQTQVPQLTQQQGQQQAMVVSCGTATTIDLLHANGQHQGGYIVPGLGLMHQSIGTATADKNIQDRLKQQQKPELANSTHGALANGILHMQVAFIETVYAQQHSDNIRLYLTGGAAEYIAPFLRVPHQLELALVFKGMQVHTQAQ